MSMHELRIPTQWQTLQRNMSRRIVLKGLVGAFMAGSVSSTLLGCDNNNNKQTPTPTPTPTPRKTTSTSGQTITVNFVYSTEKEGWMTKAIEDFTNQSFSCHGKCIYVNPQGMETNGFEYGSLDAEQKILNHELIPTAWSPASTLELNLLTADWRIKKKDPNAEIFNNAAEFEPRSLVFSPLVIAIWQERAQLLQKKYSNNIDWMSIHDALTLKNGWADIGGLSNWGLVKFGHTLPIKSNSGLLTITLMAYAFYKQQRGLVVNQIDDGKFLAYLDDFENAVNAFGRSSGTFLNNVVIPQGAAVYDVITTYENLVLTLQGQPFQIFYPPLNIESDHPFAIFQWASPEEQDAAKMFRDFLLGADMQRLARTFGFRPGNTQVPLEENSPDNVFLKPPLGITPPPQIQPRAQYPDGNVIAEMIKQWKCRYSNKQIAVG